MRYDLHMHSNYSRDGQYSCEQLITFVKQQQIDVIALCDHNSIEGVQEITDFAQKENITVVAAIELDTRFEGIDMHILGYGININNPYYKNLPHHINTIMDNVTQTRIQRFEEVYNITLDQDKMFANFKEGDNPFFYIVEHMFQTYPDIPDFEPYLEGGEKSNSPIPNYYFDHCSNAKKCYVEVLYPSLEDSIAQIHKDGGVAILAHPNNLFFHNTGLLHRLIKAGIDGIEAFSNYHDAKKNEYYKNFCLQNNLYISMGSDFHGVLKPKIKIGEFGLSPDLQEQYIQPLCDRLLSRFGE